VGNLLYLLGAVAAIAVICSVLYVRTRRPNSVEYDVDSFQRGLKALSPDRRPNERDGRRSG